LLSAKALAGVAVYIIGHGFTKAALFMCAGVLLHRFRTVDEFDLHGRGRDIRRVGVLFAVGGVLLAAPPPLTAFAGKSLLESASSDAGYGWLAALFVIVSALTGGAVLRVAGRVWLGWGPATGPDPSQARAAEERVDETRDERDHTPVLMIVVPFVLLVLAAVVGVIPGAVPWVERMATRFVDHRAYAAWVLHGAAVHWPATPVTHVEALDVVTALVAVLGAFGVAAVGLFGRGIREALPSAVSGPARAAVRQLRQLHSGHIGDYIAWWSAGASALGAVCLVVLR
jgi:multicomponent Na+:H+ antiporter subunit D